MGYLADGAGVGTVLLVIEHVFPQRRLALETRVTDIAERVGPQMRLEHVETHQSHDAAQPAAVDRLFPRRHQMADEIAVRFELLPALEARVHLEVVGPAQVLHHLLDREVVDVAQVARVRLVQRLHAELVQDFARGVDVDVLVRFRVAHVLHVDVADFGEELDLRVFAQPAQQVAVVGRFQVLADVFQVRLVRFVAQADGTVQQLDAPQRFLHPQQEFVQQRLQLRLPVDFVSRR